MLQGASTACLNHPANTLNNINRSPSHKAPWWPGQGWGLCRGAPRQRSMPTREGVRDVSAQPEPTELPEPPQRPGAASPPRGDTAELVPESVPRRPPAPQVAVGEVGVGDELLHSLQGRPPVLDCGHGGGTAPALPHAAQARPSPFGTRSGPARSPFGALSKAARRRSGAVRRSPPGPQRSGRHRGSLTSPPALLPPEPAALGSNSGRLGWERPSGPRE